MCTGSVKSSNVFRKCQKFQCVPEVPKVPTCSGSTKSSNVFRKSQKFQRDPEVPKVPMCSASSKSSNVFRKCQKNFTVTFCTYLKTKKEETRVNLKQEYFTLYHREFSVSVSLFNLPLLFLFFLLYFFLLLIFVSLFISSGFGGTRLSSFPKLSNPICELHTLLYNAFAILVLEYKCQGGILTSDLQIMSRLRISGAYYALTSGTGEPLTPVTISILIKLLFIHQLMHQ